MSHGTRNQSVVSAQSAGRPSTPPTHYVDTAALMRIKSLELRARTVVEGFWNGLHRSPIHGFSVEFTEYRQYTPGDDPRYLDWRLYARSDRYYVKRFEDETNLRCHVLFDMSRSMSYGSDGYSKSDYAKTLAASLAYFLTTQRDAVGLITFDGQIVEQIPARFRPGQLRRILLTLDQSSDGRETDLARPLEQIAERLAKRGLLVLISDLLAPLDALETNLGYLQARGHEVVVLQVLDPAEIDFDFETPALFQDVETGREIYVDPASARAVYQHNLQQHLAAIRTTCEKLGVTFHRFATDLPLELAFVELMRGRHRNRAAKVRRARNTARRAA